MKKLFFFFFGCLIVSVAAQAQDIDVKSPDGRLVMTLHTDGGQAAYSVTLDGRQMLTRSRLGLTTDMGDFTQGLSMKSVKNTDPDWDVNLTRVKCSHSSGSAAGIVAQFANADGKLFDSFGKLR